MLLEHNDTMLSFQRDILTLRAPSLMHSALRNIQIKNKINLFTHDVRYPPWAINSTFFEFQTPIPCEVCFTLFPVQPTWLITITHDLFGNGMKEKTTTIILKVIGDRETRSTTIITLEPRNVASMTMQWAPTLGNSFLQKYTLNIIGKFPQRRLFCMVVGHTTSWCIRFVYYGAMARSIERRFFSKSPAESQSSTLSPQRAQSSCYIPRSWPWSYGSRRRFDIPHPEAFSADNFLFLGLFSFTIISWAWDVFLIMWRLYVIDHQALKLSVFMCFRNSWRLVFA